jgi:hypothetical protein
MHDLPVAVSTIHRILKELGITWKVLTRTARERDEVQQAEWRASMRHFTPQQLLFVDESACDKCTLWRTHGRAPKGQRPVESVSHGHGEHISILPAIGYEGYVAIRTVCGAVDSAEFFNFILVDVLSVLCVLRNQYSLPQGGGGIDVVRGTYNMMLRRHFCQNFRRPLRILRTFSGDLLSILCPFSVYSLSILCLLSCDSSSVRGAGQQRPLVSYHPKYNLLPFHSPSQTAL